MKDRDIIQSCAQEIGIQIGKLQGQLFASEARSEALRMEIQRLDTVYQNLATQVQTPTQPPSTTECLAALNKLADLDPADQPVCSAVYDLLVLPEFASTPGPERAQRAVALMESHGWKQGEAIALAQRVVQHLRSIW